MTFKLWYLLWWVAEGREPGEESAGSGIPMVARPYKEAGATTKGVGTRSTRYRKREVQIALPPLEL